MNGSGVFYRAAGSSTWSLRPELPHQSNSRFTIDKAGNQLAAKQGSNPLAWRSSATRERITFVPGLLPFTMRYTNRPSGIQQVVSFSGHSAQDTGR